MTNKEEPNGVDVSFKDHKAEETKEQPTPEQKALNENPFFANKNENDEIQPAPQQQPVQVSPPEYNNKRKKIESSPNFMLNKKKVGKAPPNQLNMFMKKTSNDEKAVYKADHITEIGTVNLNMIINNQLKSPGSNSAHSTMDQIPKPGEEIDTRSNKGIKKPCCSLEKEKGNNCNCSIF